MIAILAAAAAAAAEPPPPAVAEIEVVTRAPIVGTLTQGVQAYRPEFFTTVRPGTALDMIQWLPGFTFEDVRDVRGLGGAVGNVLIDGQPPTSKNDTLATVLRRIPAAQVERVDIIVGGAPGIDMRGRTVIANVVLKKTTATTGQISAQSIVMDDARLGPELSANLSRKSETRATEASVTVARRLVQGNGPGEGPLVRTDGAGVVVFAARSMIGGRINVATATAAHEVPFAGGKLRANGSFTYVKARAAEETTVVGLPALYATELLEEFGQGEAGLRYTRPFGRYTLETQVLQRINAHHGATFTSRPPLLTDLDVNDTLRESVARATWRFKRDDRFSWETSAEVALNGLDTRSDYAVDGRPTRLPTGDVDIRERRADVGGLFTWKPGSKHTLTGALRVETSNLSSERDVVLERSLTYLKPRAVYAWSIDPKTQLRFRVEREVSQISFNSFVAQVEVSNGMVRAGNPDLRPQRAWIGEAVLERQFWTGASVVLTARRQHIDDAVDFALLPQFSGALGITNIGDASTTQFIAAVTLPLKRLGLEGISLKGGATYSTSSVTDPTTRQTRRISGQAAWIGDAHFVHDIPGWKLNWGVDAVYNGTRVAPRPTTVDRYEGYWRVSTFVERRFGDDLTLRVEALNLLNQRPLWRVENYAGPRHVSPLLYVDERRNTDGRYLMVRLRKTIS